MQVKVISYSRGGRRAEIVILSNNKGGIVSTTKHVIRDGNTNEFVWKSKGTDGKEVKETYTL